MWFLLNHNKIWLYFAALKVFYSVTQRCKDKSLVKTFKDYGFTSTSFSLDVAKKFVAYDNPEETCCILHIHISEGDELHFIPIYTNDHSEHKKEHEILLPPGSTFKVITDRNEFKKTVKKMGL